MTDTSSLTPLTPSAKLPKKRMKQRSHIQLAHDRKILANLALKNPAATSRELAIMFQSQTGIPIADRTVRDDLSAMRKQWLKEYKRDMAVIQSNELARLDVLEQEAWDAWNQSKSDFIRTIIERARRPPASGPNAGGVVASIVSALADRNAYLNEEVVEAIVNDAIEQAITESVNRGEDADMFVSKIIETTESRIGNVQFLRAIHDIQRERRKIQGVYAPELHQLDIRKVELKGYAYWSPDNWFAEGGDGGAGPDGKKALPSNIIDADEYDEFEEYDEEE